MSCDPANVPSAYRTEWMHKGSYGVMVHYLVTPRGLTSRGKTRSLNRTVNQFNVDDFIRQFKDSGADWLIFTIGQNTGYYCSSNRFLDRELPGRTPDRNLILDIAWRVKELKKRFIVYLPAEVSQQDAAVKKAFRWSEDDQREFLDRYLEFVKDYSLLFGFLCDGWWFDGCYDQLCKGKWDWQRWIDAARAGNYWSAVAFNDGSFCVGREKPVTPLQDYLAGEVHLLEAGQIRMDFLAGGGEILTTQEGCLRLRGQDPKFYMPNSRCVEGVQWHALVPIDSSFAAPAIPAQHYEDEDLLPFMKRCREVGGAATLNVPINPEGHIPDATAAQLARIGRALSAPEGCKKSGCGTPTKTQGTDLPPISNPETYYVMSNFRQALLREDWRKALSMCSSETRAQAARYWFRGHYFRDALPPDPLDLHWTGDECNAGILNGQSAWGFRLKPNAEDPKSWSDRAAASVRSFLVEEKPTSALSRIVSSTVSYLLPSEPKYVIQLPPMTYAEWIAKTQSALSNRAALEEKTREEYTSATEKIHTVMTLNKTEFHAGEEIRCHIEVRNESDKNFVLRCVGLDPYFLRIVDGDGNNLTPPIPKKIQCGMWDFELASGSAVSIWNLYPDLAKANSELLRPGTYRIQHRGGVGLSAKVPADPETMTPPLWEYVRFPKEKQERPPDYVYLKFDANLDSNVVEITVLP